MVGYRGRQTREVELVERIVDDGLVHFVEDQDVKRGALPLHCRLYETHLVQDHPLALFQNTLQTLPDVLEVVFHACLARLYEHWHYEVTHLDD